MIYESFNVDRELTKIDPVDILQSGKITKKDIGKTVYLSNSVITCQEWQIADVDHAGISGTVDLISKYCIGDDTVNGGNYYLGYRYMYDSVLSSGSFLELRSDIGPSPNWIFSKFSTSVQNALEDIDKRTINGKNAGGYKMKIPTAMNLGFTKSSYIHNKNTYYCKAAADCGFSTLKEKDCVYPLFENSTADSSLRNELVQAILPNGENISDKNLQYISTKIYTSTIVGTKINYPGQDPSGYNNNGSDTGILTVSSIDGALELNNPLYVGSSYLYAVVRVIIRFGKK